MPFLCTRDDLDKVTARYFARVLTASFGISLSYLLLVGVFHVDVPARWLMSIGLLWFPIAYSMKPDLKEQQDAYSATSELRRQFRFMPGVIAALTAMWLMSSLPETGISFRQLVSTSLAVMYLMSLWNVTIVATLLHYRAFDSGGVVATALAIILGCIWAYLENQ